MTKLLLSALFLTAFSASAEQPCYQEMSAAAYAQYAKDEGYSAEQAEARADLFIDSFKTQGRNYVFNVQLAEQYATESESGYYPGTPYKVILEKDCNLVSVARVAQ